MGGREGGRHGERERGRWREGGRAPYPRRAHHDCCPRHYQPPLLTPLPVALPHIAPRTTPLHTPLLLRMFQFLCYYQREIALWMFHNLDTRSADICLDTELAAAFKVCAWWGCVCVFKTGDSGVWGGDPSHVTCHDGMCVRRSVCLSDLEQSAL